MIVVGLGSNLGSRESYLRAAALLLDGRGDVAVAARSRLYHTPPLGPPQPTYLNAALRLETALHPSALLPELLAIESALGRVRTERWGPRLLDLDILVWSGGAVRTDVLEVPHPGLAERDFAVAPLLDVAPELGDRYACTPPPTRPWAGTDADAIDALDGLAMRATARLGTPARVTRVEPFEDHLPQNGPGFIVLERWDIDVRRGSKLL